MMHKQLPLYLPHFSHLTLASLDCDKMYFCFLSGRWSKAWILSPLVPLLLQSWPVWLPLIWQAYVCTQLDWCHIHNREVSFPVPLLSKRSMYSCNQWCLRWGGGAREHKPPLILNAFFYFHVHWYTHIQLVNKRFRMTSETTPIDSGCQAWILCTFLQESHPRPVDSLDECYLFWSNAATSANVTRFGRPKNTIINKGVPVPFYDLVRNLGVLLDTALPFEGQMGVVVARNRKQRCPSRLLGNGFSWRGF